jgi:hypothetical protein
MIRCLLVTVGLVAMTVGSQAGQQLDLKCSLQKTTARGHEFTHVDRVLIDTNEPPRVELQDSTTRNATNPSNWVFTDGGEYGDTLKIVESGNTIIGSALRGIPPNDFCF